jgi:hypothetical protein
MGVMALGMNNAHHTRETGCELQLNKWRVCGKESIERWQEAEYSNARTNRHWKEQDIRDAYRRWAVQGNGRRESVS